MANQKIIYDKNNTFKDTVLGINEQFIKEAEDSPSLFSDMAAMESYMAESYNERVFSELLQNADDSQSTKISVEEYNNNLYVANDGRSFNNSDLMAMCRSGSSNKKRGSTIGYRGIGFKSSTRISEDIKIWSNQTFFTFSKKRCATELGVPIENVPTVRVPFLVENISKDIFNKINKFKNKGYTTVFVFERANLVEFISELKELESNYFLFLNNILECEINLSGIKNSFSIERTQTDNEKLVSVSDGIEKINSWSIFEGNLSSIAFKIVDGKIRPSKSAESTYHCYLPSNDSAPFNLKINGDFSTDPSRKNIMLDKYTKNVISDAINELKIIIDNLLIGKNCENLSQILLILTGSISFSKINMYFKEEFNSEISNLKLKLNSGDKQLLKDYKLLPSWLENSEKDFLRENNPYVNNLSLPYDVYRKIPGIDEFVFSYSIAKYSIYDYYKILKEENELLESAPHIYIKIYVHILKEERINQQIHDKKPVYTLNLYNNISTIINAETSRLLKEQLSTAEREWFFEVTGYDIRRKEEKILIKNKDPKRIFTNKKPAVTKWRSTEKQVVELEEQMGYKARDVSKKNVGYDIESITPNGESRYIEVKSLKNENSTFTITNNEYTSAHQLGKDYYVCLVFEGRVVYIQDPINKLHFEKRIRQWEWFCEDFSGVEIEIEER